MTCELTIQWCFRTIRFFLKYAYSDHPILYFCLNLISADSEEFNVSYSFTLRYKDLTKIREYREVVNPPLCSLKCSPTEGDSFQILFAPQFEKDVDMDRLDSESHMVISCKVNFFHFVSKFSL